MRWLNIELMRYTIDLSWHAHAWTLKPTRHRRSQGHQLKQIFFCLFALEWQQMRSSIYMWVWRRDANGKKRQHVQLFGILERRERERAKDISQHISCFLFLSHEDRKCVRRSNLIPFSLSSIFFLCQREGRLRANWPVSREKARRRMWSWPYVCAW